eukprot:gene2644-5018_t
MLLRVTRMFRDNMLKGSNRPLGHSGSRRWTLEACSSRAPRVTVRAMSDTAGTPEEKKKRAKMPFGVPDGYKTSQQREEEIQASLESEHLNQLSSEAATPVVKKRTKKLFGVPDGYKTAKQKEEEIQASTESQHPQRLSSEDQSFWVELLQTIDKPSVAEIVKSMHAEHPLGWDKEKYQAERQKSGETYKAVMVPCYATFMEHRLKLPRHVILLQIGDFFETVGYDALLLVQHCDTVTLTSSSSSRCFWIPQCGELFETVGYDALLLCGDFFETVGYDALLLVQHCDMNPMSAHKKVPRAGFPLNQMPRIDKVPRAGFPLNQMPRIVKTLNDVGLSVVIIKEEEEDSIYG